ncbi:hypothetical protein [Gulosibacter hominis]|uniref:hypothetical protein n=1 Tax=Gulosibacter hominis TaxID=2770504 RepID=UPI001918F136|nr:hypothetical protein [Gulosibacter hominis]
MTEIVVAVVNALGLVLSTACTAALGAIIPKLHKTEKNTQQVLAQVANSHTVNLRDDLDAKHAAVIRELTALADVAERNHPNDPYSKARRAAESRRRSRRPRAWPAYLGARFRR